MRYLLDTSALLAHHRQETGWEVVQAIFEADEAEIIMACISLTEFGRRLRDLGASAAIIQETVANYQLLCTEVAPVDTAVAFAALVIGWRTPRRLPLVDALIAAVAQVRGAVLVHRDGHMRAIPLDLLQQNDLGAPSDLQ
jgi:predicted nucleic acid-binding protein